ncbi:pyridoxal 5'-phosphate synthase [Streptomyces griseoviridis]|uniref:Oxidase n=1 Tax=Streptomyces griseoviridis TaxID=45398 RepID=A0A3Q9KV38_STRGD|nr:pyridoxal 5'-phosphate synthase [Streptomyces griseoviridis]AZS86638.1 pyridoxal 5'-phosphate synthase [Streptomyces griseoviridis]QCN86501.1 oxidase [Streptomyces griseoviridis]
MPETDLHTLLRSVRVWAPDATELRPFDPAVAPATPLALFTRWFADAVAAGQPEPHTMSLATTDADGRPDARIVMLHGADADGWAFATHATSRKGRQLAAQPHAALVLYWPVLGRQVRVRGPVVAAPSEEGQADLHARTTGALAAALTGRQSEPLASLSELERRSREAWERARAEPGTPSPTWTLYRLRPTEVEFFQGDPDRRHVRLRYEDTGEGADDGGAGTGGWRRVLLWP